MRLFPLLTAALLTLGLTACLGSAAITDGLVGYWNYNGDLNDSSATGANGTYNSSDADGPQYVASYDASLVTSISLDSAQTEYVTTSNASVLNFGSSIDFSMAMWIKAVSDGGQSYVAIAGKKGSRGTNRAGYHMTIADDVQGGVAIFQMSNGSEVAGTYVSVTGTKDLYDDAWHHLAVTVDRSGNAQLYYDGSPDGVAVDVSGVGDIDNTFAFNMGVIGFANSQYYNGDLDEVGVWNRLLTTDEITALAAGGPIPEPTTLVLLGPRRADGPAAPSGIETRPTRGLPSLRRPRHQTQGDIA